MNAQTIDLAVPASVMAGGVSYNIVDLDVDILHRNGRFRVIGMNSKEAQPSEWEIVNKYTGQLQSIKITKVIDASPITQGEASSSQIPEAICYFSS